MHPAKKFFYACGGLFMLAAAYHLGASKATAQTSAPSAFGVDATGSTSMVAINRTIYWMDTGGQITALPVVPGTAPIVAIGADQAYNGHVTAILEDGEVYRRDSSGNVWLHVGNLFGATTSAVQRSWGSLKVHFR